MADREIIRPPTRREFPNVSESGFRYLQQIANEINRIRSGTTFGENLTDYLEVEDDGTLRFYGESTTWLDLNFDVGALGQGAAGPTYSALSGGTIQHPMFLNSRETDVSGSMEINHQVRLDVIKPHLHWIQTNTGTGVVKFGLTYTITNGGDAEPSETTIYLTDTADGTLNKNYSVGFPDIDISGHTEGAQFSFRLFRDPADAEDTYAADVALKTFGLHVEVHSLGTRDVIDD